MSRVMSVLSQWEKIHANCRVGFDQGKQSEVNSRVGFEPGQQSHANCLVGLTESCQLSCRF